MGPQGEQYVDHFRSGCSRLHLYWPGTSPTPQVPLGLRVLPQEAPAGPQPQDTGHSQHSSLDEEKMFNPGGEDIAPGRPGGELRE